MSKEVKSFIVAGVSFCLAFFLLNVFVLDNDWNMVETLYRTAIVTVLFAVAFGVFYILVKKKKNKKDV